MRHVWVTEVHTYTVLVGRPDGKRPLGRPRRRWEGNINKTGHVRTTGFGVMYGACALDAGQLRLQTHSRVFNTVRSESRRALTSDVHVRLYRPEPI
jgi:hypothetical protein